MIRSVCYEVKRGETASIGVGKTCHWSRTLPIVLGWSLDGEL